MKNFLKYIQCSSKVYDMLKLGVHIVKTILIEQHLPSSEFCRVFFFFKGFKYFIQWVHVQAVFKKKCFLQKNDGQKQQIKNFEI